MPHSRKGMRGSVLFPTVVHEISLNHALGGSIRRNEARLLHLVLWSIVVGSYLSPTQSVAYLTLHGVGVMGYL